VVGVVLAAGVAPGALPAGVLVMVTRSAQIPITTARVARPKKVCFDGPMIVIRTMTSRRTAANRCRTRRGQAGRGEGRLRRSATHREPSQSIDNSPFGNPAAEKSRGFAARLTTGVLFGGGPADDGLAIRRCRFSVAEASARPRAGFRSVHLADQWPDVVNMKSYDGRLQSPREYRPSPAEGRPEGSTRGGPLRALVRRSPSRLGGRR
jgi:hypothetical protein